MTSLFFLLPPKEVPNKMDISPQTLQSIITRTHFFSVAASAVACTTNQSSSVTLGIRRHKCTSLSDLDNNDDVKEVVDAHFTATASAAAHTTTQTSTISPMVRCRKWDPLDFSDDDGWDGTSLDDDGKAVDDDSADGD